LSLYLDPSALLKAYVKEPGTDLVVELLGSDSEWVSARHTEVEVRRNLGRLLSGSRLTLERGRFLEDWEKFHILELDEPTCSLAARIGEETLLRTLDCLHLAAAERFGEASLVTFDAPLATKARKRGLTVVGA
jgi:predicted nucleic acid-binding protein